MLDVVARQLEDVRRDVLKDCHDVEGHLEHQHLDKDTLKIVIMRSHQDIIVKLRSRSRSGEGQEGQSFDLSSTLFLVFNTHPPTQTFFWL